MKIFTLLCVNLTLTLDHLGPVIVVLGSTTKKQNFKALQETRTRHLLAVRVWGIGHQLRGEVIVARSRAGSRAN